MFLEHLHSYTLRIRALGILQDVHHPMRITPKKSKESAINWAACLLPTWQDTANYLTLQFWSLLVTFLVLLHHTWIVFCKVLHITVIFYPCDLSCVHWVMLHLCLRSYTFAFQFSMLFVILFVSHHRLPIFVCVCTFTTLKILRLFMARYVLFHQDWIFT